MFKPLRRIFTTPQIHHWHHSSEQAVFDRNFAVSFSCIDYVMGTYYCPEDRWPEQYGLESQESLPRGFLKQLIFPFKELRLMLSRRD